MGTTDRLTSFFRGELNGTKTGISGTAKVEQVWALDALGNWDSFTEVQNGSSMTSEQYRGQDGQNRTSSYQDLSTGENFTPTYDANGNLTFDGDHTYELDAWNRLASSTVDGDEFPYEHDALGRRIVEGSSPATIPDQGSPTDVHLYYNASWQVVQETNVRGTGFGGTNTTTVSNVWSPQYIDALILRDVSVPVVFELCRRGRLGRDVASCAGAARLAGNGRRAEALWRHA